MDHLAQLQTRDLKRWDCLGNILILGEWLTPIASSMIPLVFTIAAGNTAIIILPFKTPNVAEGLKVVIGSSVDIEAFAAFAPVSERSKMGLISELSGTLFQGIVCQDTAVLAHIESIGVQTQKKVFDMPSHLAGLTPVIITRNSDIRQAAQQLARSRVSKLTERCCTCPSYVLVDEFVMEDLLQSLEAAVEDSLSPSNSSKSKQSSTSSQKPEKEWDNKGVSPMEFRGIEISVGSRQSM